VKMKKLYIWMVMVLACSLGVQAQDFQYNYRGEPRPLTLHTSRIYLLLQAGQSQADVKLLLPDAKVLAWGAQDAAKTMNLVPDVPALIPGRHWAELEFATAYTEEDYLKLIARLNTLPNVALASPFFTEPHSKPIGMSELFRVKLHSPADLLRLKQMAAQTGTKIVGQNRYMELWYTLACDKASQGNALAMADYFRLQGKFDVCEADLIPTEVLSCATDPFFPMQWGMQNTGQYGGTPGLDIRACAGWANWTTGDPSVVIGIFDQGYEQNHPDLAAGNVGVGFDAYLNAPPSVVYGAHGTACAGIAGARQNNGLGVTGVAPNCGLVSIAHPLFFTPNFEAELADGFNWAWQNNVSVISNSWGWFGAPAVVLDNAIQDALNLGRGGLGTVVCFATHNYDLPMITYPASAHPNVLSVGAMSPCGERKSPTSCDGEFWGSNYGPDLDVVAPGVIVHTTDQQAGAGYDPTDYYSHFNGTSSATPHVAGLAGLLISMNTCLTREQVNNIIEKTARKVGAYAYSSTLGRPNGEWNYEMGYGLIDIDAAMRMTREIYVQNVAINADSVIQVFGTIAAGYAVTPTVTFGNVDVNFGATLDLRASTSITLAGGFNVNPGAALNAFIIPYMSCLDWDETVGRYGPVAIVEPPVVAEATAKEVTPAAWGLEVYPNPMHTGAKVSFTLPEAAQVRLALYDVGMHKVQDLGTGSAYKAGTHALDVSSQNLAGGVYFLRMEAGGHVVVKKVVVMP
jgi:serine protease